jgi:hypothetical protein
VYFKCAGAGKEYDTLAIQIDALQGVLQNVRQTFDERDVADAPDKRRSVHIAYDACEGALHEVEAYLDKHAGIRQSSQLRWISVMKFAATDIEGLKKSLDSSGKLLERSLAALTVLSLHKLFVAIEEVKADYQHNRRARSVLSLALVDHKEVDERLAMAQVEKDLVDKDVHPDAIDFHRDEIRKWVLNIHEDAAAKSRRPDTTDPISGNTLNSVLYDPRSQTPSISGESRYTSEAFIRHSSNRIMDSPSTPIGSLRHANEHSVPFDFQMTPSETPSSRRGSLGSHRSQNAEWHPRAEEHSDYVQLMLTKPFGHAPAAGVTSDEHANFYFERAFHQMDYTERGYLTRNQVTRTCDKALVAANSPLDRQTLARIVHFGDRNRDGKVDKGEFASIMLDVLHHSLQICFDDDICRAEAEALSRYATKDGMTLALPWGFSRTTDTLYFDEIELVTVDRPPALLPLKSFTLMSQEVASRGVRIANEADEYWHKALPDPESRATFAKTFERVLDVACSFSLFYNPDSEDELSDLDDMIIDLSVLRTQQDSDKTFTSRLTDLLNVRTQCEKIALQLRGITWRIEHLNTDQVCTSNQTRWPSPETLIYDLDMWRKSHVEVWAYNIHEQWEKIRQDVAAKIIEHRQWYDEQQQSLPRSSTQPIDTQARGWMVSRARDYVKPQNDLHIRAVKVVRDYATYHRQVTGTLPNRLPISPYFAINDLRVECFESNGRIPFDNIKRSSASSEHSAESSRSLFRVKILTWDKKEILSGPHTIGNDCAKPIIMLVHVPWLRKSRPS